MINFIFAILELASAGKDVVVHLEDKCLRVGRYILIDHGVIDPEFLKKHNVSLDCSVPEILSVIEGLYAVFKVSIPSSEDDHCGSRYFKAIPYSRLTDAQLVNGHPRREARAALEATVVFAVVLGLLKWDDAMMGGSYYWQSGKDRDLVILRSWVD